MPAEAVVRLRAVLGVHDRLLAHDLQQRPGDRLGGLARRCGAGSPRTRRRPGAPGCRSRAGASAAPPRSSRSARRRPRGPASRSTYLKLSRSSTTTAPVSSKRSASDRSRIRSASSRRRFSSPVERVAVGQALELGLGPAALGDVGDRGHHRPAVLLALQRLGGHRDPGHVAAEERRPMTTSRWPSPRAGRGLRRLLGVGPDAAVLPDHVAVAGGGCSCRPCARWCCPGSGRRRRWRCGSSRRGPGARRPRSGSRRPTGRARRPGARRPARARARARCASTVETPAMPAAATKPPWMAANRSGCSWAWLPWL